MANCYVCLQGCSEGDSINLKDGTHVHKTCFLCDICKEQLPLKYCSKNGRHFHIDCYQGAKQNPPPCRRCGYPVMPAENAVHLGQGMSYHETCYCCDFCMQPLMQTFATDASGSMFHNECYSCKVCGVPLYGQMYSWAADRTMRCQNCTMVSPHSPTGRGFPQNPYQQQHFYGQQQYYPTSPATAYPQSPASPYGLANPFVQEQHTSQHYTQELNPSQHFIQEQHPSQNMDSFVLTTQQTAAQTLPKAPVTSNPPTTPVQTTPVATSSLPVAAPSNIAQSPKQERLKDEPKNGSQSLKKDSSFAESPKIVKPVGSEVDDDSEMDKTPGGTTVLPTSILDYEDQSELEPEQQIDLPNLPPPPMPSSPLGKKIVLAPLGKTANQENQTKLGPIQSTGLESKMQSVSLNSQQKNTTEKEDADDII